MHQVCLDEIHLWKHCTHASIPFSKHDLNLVIRVFQQADNELRGVQLKGHAIISDDRAVIQRVGEVIWQRYTGPLDDSARQAVAIQGAKRVVVFVKPEQVISWDHRKLGGGY